VGQWSAALCLEASIYKGSVLPYITEANKHGFGVILLNPNLNYITNPKSKNSRHSEEDDDDSIDIAGSETPLKHILYVWDNIVRKSSCSNVTILTYGAGSVVTLNALHQRAGELLARLKALAMLESNHRFAGHGFKYSKYENQVKTFLASRSANWKTRTNYPLDTPLPNYEGCLCFASGAEKSEETPFIAMQSVFKWLQEVCK